MSGQELQSGNLIHAGTVDKKTSEIYLLTNLWNYGFFISDVIAAIIISRPTLRYIAYQFVMLLSSILGPGTIFLMTVGAISISFDVNSYIAFVCVFTPVAVFATMCLTCTAEKQVAKLILVLFSWHLKLSYRSTSHNQLITLCWCFLCDLFQLMAAQTVGALFTLLMTAVIVGTALQIKKDGIYSPHAIFLFAVIGRYLIFGF